VETSPPNNWKLLYESGRQALQDRKLQEAEQSFSAALQLAEDFAPGDPRLVATLNALARIYSLQRRYLAAAALLNRLLEVTERTLGPSHVQVAGVLTNLAEMYTHLGAAREELELRERVLSIRGDDPNADAATLQRLRDRVAELRTMLAAQETTPDLDEIEPLPTVRTAEYSSPVEQSAPITTVREPEPIIAAEPMIQREPVVMREPIPAPSSSRQKAAVHDESEHATLAESSVESWADVAPKSESVEVEAVESYSYDGDPKSAVIKASPAVELISIDEQPAMDHGFSDMGRDELPAGVVRKIGSRSSFYSIAAGIVLVAGLLAARDYVKGDEASVSAGSVSLASAATPSGVIVRRFTPAQTPVVTTPVAAPAPAPEPRTVERLIADHNAEQDARRANADREGSRSGNQAGVAEQRAPRVPNAAEIERTLKSLDAASKVIDLRTKAATDSATAIRMQAPTFKKVRIADPTSGYVVP